MKKLLIGLALVAAPAHAADFNAAPVAVPGDVVSYSRGVPIVTRETETTIISITSIGEYTDRPAFVVEVFNKGHSPINFGTENITARVTDERRPTLVYSRADLDRQAKNAAIWGALAASLAGASAGTSYGSTRTCGWGRCSTTSVRYTNSYAQHAATDRAMAGVQAGLEQRLENAAQSVLQTTTIQAGDGYGGLVVISKPKAKSWPTTLTLTVFGNEFDFTMTR